MEILYFFFLLYDNTHTGGDDAVSTTAVQVEEEKKHNLLFTQSFLQPSSSNYQHQHLLPVGEFPSTPKLKISYQSLLGSYLNDDLRKCFLKNDFVFGLSLP